MPVKVLSSTFSIILVVLKGWNCCGDNLFEPPLKKFEETSTIKYKNKTPKFYWSMFSAPWIHIATISHSTFFFMYRYNIDLKRSLPVRVTT